MPEPRRHVLKFSAQFAALVAKGLKRQTVRPMAAHPRALGDLADCRGWHGVPYRAGSTKYPLASGPITRLDTVRIASEAGLLWRNGRLVLGAELGLFALADGFPTIEALFAYFRQHYNTPDFTGQLIQWRPN